jgi:hypothetical protein
MEQRRLRLGDILDDYCPRERRVTNHAVVAMIEEDVRQTRCTTCDAEHAYKGARVPKRRRKDTPSALFNDVLAGMPDLEHPHDSAPQALVVAPPTTVSEIPESVVPQSADPDVGEEPQPPMQSDHPGPDSRPSRPAAASAVSSAASETAAASSDATVDESQSDGAQGDEPSGSDGPVHRRLIRATLPRPEGQKDTRPLPEFTVRQAPARNGQGSGPYRGERMRARGGHAAGQGEPNGNRAYGQPGRFQGGRPPAVGRPASGRAGGSAGFRGGQAGPKGSRRGRGSR